MADSLLETKLFVPKARRGLMRRPRLVEALQRGVEGRLTLVSASAGSGKTTLLADWIAFSQEHPSVWLSLDSNDNQSGTFWSYVIAALQTLIPGLAETARARLAGSQSQTEQNLTELLNELSALPQEVVLILEDYHMIDSPQIHSEVSFFVEHLPENVHLVIATRADPALSLARLRARGDLVEIRASDLSFNRDETNTYLNGVMGLTLTDEQVGVLEERTEGWIAALQLAALSMQGRDDVAGFIGNFAGSDRYIVDYLVEEVLGLQQPDMRDFLLQTSILERLTGPLCEEVTGQEDGTATLEMLERANLFTVPLDDHRQWYRYHHLFADVLRARLLYEQPDHVMELHRRASNWLELNGYRAEAVQHALAGEEFERAADLVEMTLPQLRQNRQEATMRLWLDAIPDDLYENRPVLAIGYVASRLVNGESQNVETRLQQAERWLDGGPSQSRKGFVVRDETAFRQLPGAIAVYRTAMARARGDIEETIAQAHRALEVAGEDDHLERGGAAGFLALAHWSQGELEEAYRWWTEATESLERAGHTSDVLGTRIALADLLIEQGRLDDAMTTYQRGLDLVAAQGGGIRGAADMYVGLAAGYLKQDDIASAREHLKLAESLGEQAGLPQNAHRARVVKAHLLESEGDDQAAIAALDQAENLYVSDYFPDVRPIAALRARSWIRQGHARRALDWARDRGLSAQDETTYLREFEHITLAMALLATGDDGARAEALHLLERLRLAAEAGGRAENLREILTLLDVADGGAREQQAPPIEQALPDPLTEREFEVLRLLNTDLAGPEIARSLYVSLNTLRTHTKSIYMKLGVNNRRAAITRAAEMGLITNRR